MSLKIHASIVRTNLDNASVADFEIATLILLRSMILLKEDAHPTSRHEILLRSYG